MDTRTDNSLWQGQQTAACGPKLPPPRYCTVWDLTMTAVVIPRLVAGGPRPAWDRHGMGGGRPLPVVGGISAEGGTPSSGTAEFLSPSLTFTKREALAIKAYGK